MVDSTATTDRPPVHDIAPPEEPPVPTDEFRRLIAIGLRLEVIDQATADRLTGWCDHQDDARTARVEELLAALAPLAHPPLPTRSAA